MKRKWQILSDDGVYDIWGKTEADIIDHWKSEHPDKLFRLFPLGQAPHYLTLEQYDAMVELANGNKTLVLFFDRLLMADEDNWTEIIAEYRGDEQSK